MRSKIIVLLLSLTFGTAIENNINAQRQRVRHCRHNRTAVIVKVVPPPLVVVGRNDVMHKTCSPQRVWVEGHWRYNRYGNAHWVSPHWKMI